MSPEQEEKLKDALMAIGEVIDAFEIEINTLKERLDKMQNKIDSMESALIAKYILEDNT